MSKKEQKMFQIIGEVVVCGTIWLSFVFILTYGLINATTLN